ncbi:MAG: nucleotidyltransferase domain-containing protein [Desulfurococcales archaeon]|nr:nucleotidyltransferase domain-containing protein [Desulfurococcales archaeon]MCE4622888.1 nucleotidyltransferase domain-containing protein [Desulfurococcales archaeon]MCE4626704.1 nucleotidyltransferase domain-containing protein [Desulfurococcales archaeon]MCE4629681.1 nucleotidyltransferase domain-containing protein [Desulfurococcales archaeon]
MDHASTPGFVDGVIVEAVVEGLPGYYMVRGYTHTPRYVIVEPYKNVNCKGSPKAYTKYIHCLGVATTIIERGNVLRILSMPRTLELLPRSFRGQLEEFIEYLGIEWAALTGSFAVNCERQDSDIDLLALYKPGVWRTLRDLYDDGLIRQCKTRHILEKRSRGPGGEALSIDRMEKSLTDSCYKGIPYTLRLITSISDYPCYKPLIPLGFIDVELSLRPIGEPITVPTRYLGKVVRVYRGVVEERNEIVVETWRTRYQELSDGYYRVRGLLRMDDKGRLTIWPDHGGIIARA